MTMMIDRSPVAGYQYKRHVLAVPASVGLLRDLVGRQLVKWGVGRELVDDATLVVSELATNGVAACPGEVLGFAMFMSDGALVIEVQDTSAASPVRHSAGGYDVSGRGLDIVGFLADGGWGVRRPPEGGKYVWARLRPRTA